MSLAALTEIAREAGIDPAQVELAAREVVLHRGRPPARTRMGLPALLEEQRILPGPVTDAQWERIVAELRSTFQKSGIVSQFGEVREWMSGEDTTGSGPVKVRLEPFEDGTLVTVSQSTEPFAITGYTLAGSFGAVATLLGVLFALGDFEPQVFGVAGLMVILSALSPLVTWMAGRSWVPRQEEKMRGVLARLEGLG